MRIALGIEYDGRAFCGWQFQDHSPSVQEAVEKALSKVANHFMLPSKLFILIQTSHVNLTNG